jgi:hypothetical protein
VKTFIIAGNYNQFLNYTRDKNRNDYVYVSSTDRLKGYSKPTGRFIGTWYQRKDLGDILDQLKVAGSIDFDKLNEILEKRFSILLAERFGGRKW